MSSACINKGRINLSCDFCGSSGIAAPVVRVTLSDENTRAIAAHNVKTNARVEIFSRDLATTLVAHGDPTSLQAVFLTDLAAIVAGSPGTLDDLYERTIDDCPWCGHALNIPLKREGVGHDS